MGIFDFLKKNKNINDNKSEIENDLPMEVKDIIDEFSNSINFEKTWDRGIIYNSTWSNLFNSTCRNTRSRMLELLFRQYTF